MPHDETVLASIHLHAILRNLEDLCLVDPEAASRVKDAGAAIRFSVPGLDRLILDFRGGRCQALRADGPYNMNLHFSSPAHFNGLIEGTKSPIPTSGFRYISFLKNDFSALAERLSSYLKADPERLAQDPEFRRRSTILTANTAFFALAEIANLDKLGRVNASRIPDGIIAVEAEDLAFQLTCRGGHMTTGKARSPRPDALMRFDSLETAGAILSGSLDSYAAIGSGRLALSGRIPMLDNLNKLLSQVALYLS